MSEFSDAAVAIQTFVNTYKTRELDQFLARLIDDVLIEDDAAPSHQGKAAVRGLYQQLSARDSGQRSTLLGRMVMDAYVVDGVDKEYLSGRLPTPFTVLTICRVMNEHIADMCLHREANSSTNPFGWQA